jgi:hypothetical protein
MKTAEELRVARVIEQGIAIDAVDGAAHAWVYMTAHNIPAATIMRVLSEAGKRKTADVGMSAQPS